MQMSSSAAHGSPRLGGRWTMPTSRPSRRRLTCIGTRGSSGALPLTTVNGLPSARRPSSTASSCQSPACQTWSTRAKRSDTTASSAATRYRPCVSPMRPSRSIDHELTDLQDSCRACDRCVRDGIIPAAAPTFHGEAGAPFFLVGQAPGPVEIEEGRPFAGRAGRELGRWMARAGFTSDEEFRRLTYLTAVMRCFPGREPSGKGDRPPPERAMRNCADWLDAELALLRPRVLIPVGQLAIRRFLGPGSLEERVGKTFNGERLVIPLPHPSGQSRWLNDPANRERLARALDALGGQRRLALGEADPGVRPTPGSVRSC